MVRVLKAATRPTAAVVVVPERIPPAGLVPIATVTLPVNVVTRFPWLSRALTCTEGAITVPAAVTVGCTENASTFARPTVLSNGVLAVHVSPVHVAARV